MEENIKNIINNINLDKDEEQILEIILEKISLTDLNPSDSDLKSIARDIYK